MVKDTGVSLVPATQAVVGGAPTAQTSLQDAPKTSSMAMTKNEKDNTDPSTDGGVSENQADNFSSPLSKPESSIQKGESSQGGQRSHLPALSGSVFASLRAYHQKNMLKQEYENTVERLKKVETKAQQQCSPKVGEKAERARERKPQAPEPQMVQARMLLRQISRQRVEQRTREAHSTQQALKEREKELQQQQQTQRTFSPRERILSNIRPANISTAYGSPVSTRRELLTAAAAASPSQGHGRQSQEILKAQNQYNNLLKELLTTELNYFASLEKFHLHIHRGILYSTEEKVYELLQIPEISVIFALMDQLRVLSGAFASELSRIISPVSSSMESSNPSGSSLTPARRQAIHVSTQSPRTRNSSTTSGVAPPKVACHPEIVANLVAHYARIFRAYGTFVSYHEDANVQFQAASASDSTGTIANFLKRVSDVYCNGQSLSTFLIRPVQRIPQYILLIKGVFNAVSTVRNLSKTVSDPERGRRVAGSAETYEWASEKSCLALDKAHQAMVDTATLMNDALREAEDRKQLRELHKRFIFLAPDEEIDSSLFSTHSSPSEHRSQSSPSISESLGKSYRRKSDKSSNRSSSSSPVENHLFIPGRYLVKEGFLTRVYLDEDDEEEAEVDYLDGEDEKPLEKERGEIEIEKDGKKEKRKQDTKKNKERSQTQRRKKYYFHLLNDILIYSDVQQLSPSSSSSSPSSGLLFYPRHIFDLRRDKITILRTPSRANVSPSSISFGFHLYSLKKSFVCLADSAEEREQWIAEIENCVENQQILEARHRRKEREREKLKAKEQQKKDEIQINPSTVSTLFSPLITSSSVSTGGVGMKRRSVLSTSVSASSSLSPTTGGPAQVSPRHSSVEKDRKLGGQRKRNLRPRLRYGEKETEWKIKEMLSMFENPLAIAFPSTSIGILSKSPKPGENVELTGRAEDEGKNMKKTLSLPSLPSDSIRSLPRSASALLSSTASTSVSSSLAIAALSKTRRFVRHGPLLARTERTNNMARKRKRTLGNTKATVETRTLFLSASSDNKTNGGDLSTGRDALPVKLYHYFLFSDCLILGRSLSPFSSAATSSSQRKLAFVKSFPLSSLSQIVDFIPERNEMFQGEDRQDFLLWQRSLQFVFSLDITKPIGHAREIGETQADSEGLETIKEGTKTRGGYVVLEDVEEELNSESHQEDDEHKEKEDSEASASATHSLDDSDIVTVSFAHPSEKEKLVGDIIVLLNNSNPDSSQSVLSHAKQEESETEEEEEEDDIMSSPSFALLSPQSQMREQERGKELATSSQHKRALIKTSSKPSKLVPPPPPPRLSINEDYALSSPVGSSPYGSSPSANLRTFGSLSSLSLSTASNELARQLRAFDVLEKDPESAQLHNIQEDLKRLLASLHSSSRGSKMNTKWIFVLAEIKYLKEDTETEVRDPGENGQLVQRLSHEKKRRMKDFLDGKLFADTVGFQSSSPITNVTQEAREEESIVGGKYRDEEADEEKALEAAELTLQADWNLSSALSKKVYGRWMLSEDKLLLLIELLHGRLAAFCTEKRNFQSHAEEHDLEVLEEDLYEMDILESSTAKSPMAFDSAPNSAPDILRLFEAMVAQEDLGHLEQNILRPVSSRKLFKLLLLALRATDYRSCSSNAAGSPPGVAVIPPSAFRALARKIYETGKSQFNAPVAGYATPLRLTNARSAEPKADWSDSTVMKTTSASSNTPGTPSLPGLSASSFAAQILLDVLKEIEQMPLHSQTLLHHLVRLFERLETATTCSQQDPTAPQSSTFHSFRRVLRRLAPLIIRPSGMLVSAVSEKERVVSCIVLQLLVALHRSYESELTLRKPSEMTNKHRYLATLPIVFAAFLPELQGKNTTIARKSGQRLSLFDEMEELEDINESVSSQKDEEEERDWIFAGESASLQSVPKDEKDKAEKGVEDDGSAIIKENAKSRENGHGDKRLELRATPAEEDNQEESLLLSADRHPKANSRDEPQVLEEVEEAPPNQQEKQKKNAPVSIFVTSLEDFLGYSYSSSPRLPPASLAPVSNSTESVRETSQNEENSTSLRTLPLAFSLATPKEPGEEEGGKGEMEALKDKFVPAIPLPPRRAIPPIPSHEMGKRERTSSQPIASSSGPSTRKLSLPSSSSSSSTAQLFVLPPNNNEREAVEENAASIDDKGKSTSPASSHFSNNIRAYPVILPEDDALAISTLSGLKPSIYTADTVKKEVEKSSWPHNEELENEPTPEENNQSEVEEEGADIAKRDKRIDANEQKERENDAQESKEKTPSFSLSQEEEYHADSLESLSVRTRRRAFPLTIIKTTTATPISVPPLPAISVSKIITADALSEEEEEENESENVTEEAETSDLGEDWALRDFATPLVGEEEEEEITPKNNQNEEQNAKAEILLQPPLTLRCKEEEKTGRAVEEATEEEEEGSYFSACEEEEEKFAAGVGEKEADRIEGKDIDPSLLPRVPDATPEQEKATGGNGAMEHEEGNNSGDIENVSLPSLHTFQKAAEGNTSTVNTVTPSLPTFSSVPTENFSAYGTKEPEEAEKHFSEGEESREIMTNVSPSSREITNGSSAFKEERTVGQEIGEPLKEHSASHREESSDGIEKVQFAPSSFSPITSLAQETWSHDEQGDGTCPPSPSEKGSRVEDKERPELAKAALASTASVPKKEDHGTVVAHIPLYHPQESDNSQGVPESDEWKDQEGAEKISTGAAAAAKPLSEGSHVSVIAPLLISQRLSDTTNVCKADDEPDQEHRGVDFDGAGDAIPLLKTSQEKSYKNNAPLLLAQCSNGDTEQPNSDQEHEEERHAGTDEENERSGSAPARAPTPSLALLPLAFAEIPNLEEQTLKNDKEDKAQGEEEMEDLEKETSVPLLLLRSVEDFNLVRTPPEEEEDKEEEIQQDAEEEDITLITSIATVSVLSPVARSPSVHHDKEEREENTGGDETHEEHVEPFSPSSSPPAKEDAEQQARSFSSSTAPPYEEDLFRELPLKRKEAPLSLDNRASPGLSEDRNEDMREGPGQQAFTEYKDVSDRAVEDEDGALISSKLFSPSSSLDLSPPPPLSIVYQEGDEQGQSITQGTTFMRRRSSAASTLSSYSETETSFFFSTLREDFSSSASSHFVAAAVARIEGDKELSVPEEARVEGQQGQEEEAEEEIFLRLIDDNKRAREEHKSSLDTDSPVFGMSSRSLPSTLEEEDDREEDDDESEQKVTNRKIQEDLIGEETDRNALQLPREDFSEEQMQSLEHDILSRGLSRGETPTEQEEGQKAQEEAENPEVHVGEKKAKRRESKRSKDRKKGRRRTGGDEQLRQQEHEERVRDNLATPPPYPLEPGQQKEDTPGSGPVFLEPLQMMQSLLQVAEVSAHLTKSIGVAMSPARPALPVTSPAHAPSTTAPPAPVNTASMFPLFGEDDTSTEQKDIDANDGLSENTSQVEDSPDDLSGGRERSASSVKSQVDDAKQFPRSRSVEPRSTPPSIVTSARSSDGGNRSAGGGIILYEPPAQTKSTPSHSGSTKDPRTPSRLQQSNRTGTTPSSRGNSTFTQQRPETVSIPDLTDQSAPWTTARTPITKRRKSAKEVNALMNDHRAYHFESDQTSHVKPRRRASSAVPPPESDRIFAELTLLQKSLSTSSSLDEMNNNRKEDSEDKAPAPSGLYATATTPGKSASAASPASFDSLRSRIRRRISSLVFASPGSSPGTTTAVASTTHAGTQPTRDRGVRAVDVPSGSYPQVRSAGGLGSANISAASSPASYVTAREDLDSGYGLQEKPGFNALSALSASQRVLNQGQYQRGADTAAFGGQDRNRLLHSVSAPSSAVSGRARPVVSQYEKESVAPISLPPSPSSIASAFSSQSSSSFFSTSTIRKGGGADGGSDGKENSTRETLILEEEEELKPEMLQQNDWTGKKPPPLWLYQGPVPSAAPGSAAHPREVVNRNPEKQVYNDNNISARQRQQQRDTPKTHSSRRGVSERSGAAQHSRFRQQQQRQQESNSINPSSPAGLGGLPLPPLEDKFLETLVWAAATSSAADLHSGPSSQSTSPARPLSAYQQQHSKRNSNSVMSFSSSSSVSAPGASPARLGTRDEAIRMEGERKEGNDRGRNTPSKSNSSLSTQQTFTDQRIEDDDVKRRRSKTPQKAKTDAENTSTSEPSFDDVQRARREEPRGVQRAQERARPREHSPVSPHSSHLRNRSYDENKLNQSSSANRSSLPSSTSSSLTPSSSSHARETGKETGASGATSYASSLFGKLLGSARGGHQHNNDRGEGNQNRNRRSLDSSPSVFSSSTFFHRGQDHK